MRILIVGASGLLGHALFDELSVHHDVWGTARSAINRIKQLPNVRSDRVLPNVDVAQAGTVERAIRTAQPDVVINCVGLTRHRETGADRLPAIEMNARFPHLLAGMCGDAGSRLIHISTDCVFSGHTGNYKETDITDAVDIYGVTKKLGEVVDQPHCLTLRTSFIGHELETHYGLLEWFLAQTGQVKGYRKAIFSGFTTLEIANLVQSQVLHRSDLSGLFHLSSAPINKYELLRMIKQAYHHPVEIEPDDRLVIDRSLDSSRFREATRYEPPNWYTMISQMASKPT